MSTGRNHALRLRAEASAAPPSRHQMAFLDSYEVYRELEICKRALVLQDEELRGLETELEASRSRARELFRLAPVAYVVAGTRGIIEANALAGELLGVPACDLTGARLAHFVTPRDSDAYARYETVLRGAERASVEVTLVRSTGERVEARLESVRTSSFPREWRTAIVDLTSEKRLARVVIDSRRADAVGPVTRELAHEMGHLLMGIVGAVDRVLATLDEGDPRRKSIAEIKGSALRGGTVAEHILARARAGGVLRGSMLLDEGIREVIASLVPMVSQAARLGLSLNAAGITVRLDATALHQILSNLVTNACEAMRGHGEVRVATYPLEESGDAAGAATFVVVEVSDSGPGFSAEARAHGHEPHFSSKPTGIGGGVGLPSVCMIAQAAGGHVRLESAPEGGASVRVYLPMTRVFSGECRALGQCILLVDDEPLVRVSARRSLERAGYRVLEAGSAEQALEILGHETSAIELVVSDVGLPAMRGPELLALASALVPGVGTLLMSGDSRATLVRAGYIADDTEFLAKPFGAAELVEGVRGALDQRAAALPPASGIGRSGRAEEPTRERGK